MTECPRFKWYHWHISCCLLMLSMSNLRPLRTRQVGPRFPFGDLYGRASSRAGYFPGYETRPEGVVVETDRLAVELGSSYRSPQNHQLISERRILRLEPGSRLERRSQDRTTSQISRDDCVKQPVASVKAEDDPVDLVPNSARVSAFQTPGRQNQMLAQILSPACPPGCDVIPGTPASQRSGPARY
jgi:hypothetical protein